MCVKIIHEHNLTNKHKSIMDNENLTKYVKWGLQGTFVLGASGFLAYRYKVCRPDQFLVRTGVGIKDMSVTKKAIQWPFQKASFIDMAPMTFDFNLHNMSKEKVEFKLPVVFTIAPIDPWNDLESFKNYARRMEGLDRHGIRDTISGMIEGETRGLTAKMTIEEMFSGKDSFKEIVVDKIDYDLGQLGMQIINANIKEMADYDDKNKYFEYRKKRAIETANYEAQVEVSSAKKDGEIGVAKNIGETRIATAEIERDAKVKENEREMIIAQSNAELRVVEAEATKRAEIAKIEADMAAKERENELQKEVEIKRAKQELEARRAEIMSVAIAESEAIERRAEASLFAKKKEVEGILSLLEAQAEGLGRIRTEAGDAKLTQFYLGLNEGLYPALAKEAADAVRGMNPKVHLWKTGNDAFDTNTLLPVTKMMQSFAPALDGIQEDIKLPSWLPSSKDK